MNEDWDHIADAEERGRTIRLIAELEQRDGLRCPRCQQPVCGHQYVVSAAMGFKNAPQCLACLALDLDQSADDLFDRVAGYIARRRCFAAAWQWANRDEGEVDISKPTTMSSYSCLAKFAEPNRAPSPEPVAAVTSGETPACDARFDAGDLSCGDLVLELRLRLSKMSPGQHLELIASDLAAPIDIPAWCGLTGHRLIRSAPPRFTIRRKDA